MQDRAAQDTWPKAKTHNNCLFSIYQNNRASQVDVNDNVLQATPSSGGLKSQVLCSYKAHHRQSGTQ